MNKKNESAFDSVKDNNADNATVRREENHAKRKSTIKDKGNL